MQPRNIKHKHATPNPIIQHEEEVLLAVVDRALDSSTNSQIIGRNGEIPLRDFLNRYLPFTLHAVTGHFVSPSGLMSPQIDIIIYDTRYPLLAENADGSVLVMLHSVVLTIEVKTNLTTRDIEKAWKDGAKIMGLAKEIEGYGGYYWGAISCFVLAYRCASRLETLENKFIKTGTSEKCCLNIYALRFSEKDTKKKMGFELNFAPDFESDDSNTIIGWDEFAHHVLPRYQICTTL